MTYHPPKVAKAKRSTNHRSSLPGLSETTWVRVEEIANSCGLSPLEIVADMVHYCSETKSKKTKQNPPLVS